jgi:hypothetical protein
MTIAAVYASDLSRVRVSCSGVTSLADYATIERSVDQITWFTVRGGSAVTLTAGACQLDDYEFVPGVVNYYRARYVDTADPSVGAVGTLSTGNNASVNPGLPAGLVDNDVIMMYAAIRNTAAAVSVPAGWSTWVDGGNFKIFIRVWTTGVAAPTVAFTGGAAGDDTMARIISVKNADFDITGLAMKSNASAADIAFDPMAVAGTLANLFVLVGWKQTTSTGATLAGWTLIARDTATAGNDETGIWYQKTSTVNSLAGAISGLGGSSAVSKSTILRFTRRPYLVQETATITPTITSVWMKNIAQPFLNRAIVPTDFSAIQLPSRSGSFPVVGRSSNVAVTELRGGDNYTLTVKTETDAECEDLKAVLASGEVVLLQLPHDFRRFPGGYFLINNVAIRRAQSVRSPRRYFDLDLEEVAAPSSVLVGNTITWQGVINAYATWADVIAANATWLDLMNRIGSPSDVVVP